LRLGDSVEQVLLTGDGSTFYVNSRLGGGYLLGYEVDTGIYTTFTITVTADRKIYLPLVLRGY
jgi:hypothetical protein